MRVREKMSLPKIESTRSAGVGPPLRGRAKVVTCAWASVVRVDGKGNKIIEWTRESPAYLLRFVQGDSWRPRPISRHTGQRVLDIREVWIGELAVHRFTAP